MKRWNCREFHETKFCPAVLRDGLTDFLSFFVLYSHIYDPVVKRIATLLERSRESRLTDLCAGGGLYDRMLVGKLRKLTGDGAIRCTLTDLYPNRNWAQVKELSGGMVDFAAVPLSAERAVAGLPGVHLMFSALHHFSPEEIAGLLRAGAAKGRTLAFFDYSRRELLPELPPVLLSPVLLWCVSFLVFPFSWRRLFFTYLIPVLPLVLLVDGFLSRMRSYTAAELEEIARGAGLPEGYRVVVEVLPVYGGAAKIHCLIARPLQNS